MISLILPYWERQKAADRALESIARSYQDLQLQVIVVDDGSREPFTMPQLPLNIMRVRLPMKSEPLSPVTCWNYGVSFARGDTIVISCIEVVHEMPVLEQMAAELELIGPDAYVLAAAWCPESKQWHCHSSGSARGAYPLPEGCGRGFLGMMKRELFQRAGGFDEEYRLGAGYEDVDFVYRMLNAGAKFKIRDDLVVLHPKTDAVTEWGADKFERNFRLLKEKWEC